MGEENREGLQILDDTMARDCGGVQRAGDPAGRPWVELRRVQGRENAPASCVPAEGRQEEAGKRAGGAEEGHEEQDPVAAGSGDRQGHDHRPGEVGGEGIGGLSQEKTLITARPPVEMQSDSNRNNSPPQDPGYDPAACIHENNFKEEALIKANRRSVQVGPNLVGTPQETLTSTLSNRAVSGKKITKVHVAEIPGLQTGEPGPSHRSDKYLNIGPKTRRPAGLAAGVDCPRWLRGLESFFGRAEGGAEPEVDGARAGPQGTAKTAKYTKNEQKETRTGTNRAG